MRIIGLNALLMQHVCVQILPTSFEATKGGTLFGTLYVECMNEHVNLWRYMYIRCADIASRQTRGHHYVLCSTVA